MGIPVRIQRISRRTVGKGAYRLLLAGSTVFVLLVGLFAYIAKQVHDGDTLTRDSEILLKINNHSSTLFDAVSLAITYSGNILTVVIMTSLFLLLLYRKGYVRSVVQTAFAVGGAIATNAVLKLIFQRERPELWQLLTHESTYSFPSGHALITAALATTFILICWNTRFRWAGLLLGVAYTASVGISRLYLGVHYPTDVLAGWCLGIAWAILVALILKVILIGEDTESVKSKP